MLMRVSAVAPLALFAVAAATPTPAPTKVRLVLQTLHAAALTTPRAATDSVDEPYLLVSVLGPKTASETMHLPTTGHMRIHLDEALGARPLVDLNVAPGDSVRLLVSVLDGAKSKHVDEGAVAAAAAKAFSGPMATRSTALASALAPATSDGARWLGSATLLVTNENGTVYWRALECVSTCKVLSGADAKPFAAPGGAPLAGVVQLEGAGASYHMQVQGQQAQ
jgi:hypothetical protein